MTATPRSDLAADGVAPDRYPRGASRQVPTAGSLSGRTVLGWLTLAASALYFLSDVIETIEGGFSAAQLWITLVAEAAIPVFVIWCALAGRLGRLGILAALAYAYSYVVFSGTVVYALVNATRDYATLTDQLHTVMFVHGAVMVVAGLGFGAAVIRARTLPSWTGIALIAGVVLVALTQHMPDAVQLLAAGLRDLGFAGMGAAILRPRPGNPLMPPARGHAAATH
jgi:hypothetical protein